MFLPLANEAGAEDGHISKYNWDWLIKHRSNPLPGYEDKGKQLDR